MLYGRSMILEYVRAALQRDGVPPQPFRVMLLLGPQGSGGSAVLRELETRHRRSVLDLTNEKDVGSVVFAAVHELTQQRRDSHLLGRSCSGLRAAGPAATQAGQSPPVASGVSVSA
jgi:hypothetical protein